MRTFKARPSQLGKIMSNAKKDVELSAGCITYLTEWATDTFEEVSSKYMTKGILMEDKAIDFMASQLGFGIAEKNLDIYSNDYLVGTPDVIIGNVVIDLKCSWNRKTLYEASLSLDKDYEWQLRAYMALTGCDEAILFYALMDTPSEANYGKEVIYSNLPDKDRWVAYKFKRDAEKEEQIYKKIDKCREWLKEFQPKLGVINEQ